MGSGAPRGPRTGARASDRLGGWIVGPDGTRALAEPATDGGVARAPVDAEPPADGRGAGARLAANSAAVAATPWSHDGRRDAAARSRAHRRGLPLRLDPDGRRRRAADRRRRSADRRLGADRRHERAAGARAGGGRRSSSPATCSRARCRCSSRGSSPATAVVEVLCGLAAVGGRDLVGVRRVPERARRRDGRRDDARHPAAGGAAGAAGVRRW